MSLLQTLAEQWASQHHCSGAKRASVNSRTNATFTATKSDTVHSGRLSAHIDVSQALLLISITSTWLHVSSWAQPRRSMSPLKPVRAIRRQTACVTTSALVSMATMQATVQARRMENKTDSEDEISEYRQNKTVASTRYCAEHSMASMKDASMKRAKAP
eukprot:TRINITY_DN41002_c0_g1_i2.p1 TRINITY_DN41002_c0_g1~~TRINITY_DN41002_c0_g1_i2.p1  ORF type:complete len:159 (-),score=14.08 TRINITY_DN41002_c0_g1_i2:112-588(-)